MFRVRMILRSVLRHRRRNLVSCLLLAVILSIPLCAFFYAELASAEVKRMEALYSRRYAVTFRSALQYDPAYPHWSAFESLLNGSSTTDGKPDIFFDPEEMADYAHPYPVTKEVFNTLGESGYCADYALAYADTAYGFSGVLPSQVQTNLDTFYSMHGGEAPEKMFTEHIVVGGSLEAFTGLAREHGSYLYDFHLREGREPEADECVITDFYAQIYGLTTGDTLTLYDLYENPIKQLTVSGIYEVYRTEFYEQTDPSVPDSGRRITGASIIEDFDDSPDFGTPYDRLCEDMEAFQYRQTHYKEEYFCVSGAMLALIHTDFDTAYTLYGTSETDPMFADRHHINHFFAVYDLTEPAMGELLAADAQALLPAEWRDQFTAEPFSHSLAEYRKAAEHLAADADLLLRFFIPLAAGILLLAAVVLVRENGRETGICLGLGISETDTVLRSALESTVVTAVSVIPAWLISGGIHRLMISDSPYLQMLAPDYRITASGVLFVCVMLAGAFGITTVFTALYIRIHTPIRLIRQE
ncbi:MAG: hypothetical protein IKY52_07685 [Clostridia bacterium]|nr:hypothetical protein [Clostridia bacterium]